MKSNFIVTAIITLSVILSTATSARSQDFLKRADRSITDGTEKIALAYVIDNIPDIPDAEIFSHLIYAFAVFNDNLDGVVIKYPEKLKALAKLKEKNPELKVMLGLNDYRRPGFSEMAGDKKKRKAYVKSVKEIIKTYNLDGADLDWEFPTIEGQGHNFTPEDDINYVKLVKDLRKALGKKAWISYYSNHTGRWIDHKGMVPYVSYVHVSGYNLSEPIEGKPLLHHSALYPASKTGDWCVSKVIERHINLGIPKEKILMGIPFFGIGMSPYPKYVECKDFSKYSSGPLIKWDDDAKAPYITDENDNLILGFDDERSIAAKFDFVRANQIPGIFVWNYEADYKDHKLGKAIKRLRKGN
ncbi:MAG: hypothetical protein K2G85_05325 [Muribaculaceae bacterium]|nr:hypothetical protein [Muribaculaceae bacterium]